MAWEGEGKRGGGGGGSLLLKSREGKRNEVSNAVIHSPFRRLLVMNVKDRPQDLLAAADVLSSRVQGGREGQGM